jgi:hypothetical protein
MLPEAFRMHPAGLQSAFANIMRNTEITNLDILFKKQLVFFPRLHVAKEA